MADQNVSKLDGYVVMDYGGSGALVDKAQAYVVDGPSPDRASASSAKAYAIEGYAVVPQAVKVQGFQIEGWFWVPSLTKCIAYAIIDDSGTAANGRRPSLFVTT